MTVHIGYHKTATTFLQKVVFPTFKGIRFYDYFECRDIFRELVYGSTLTFDKETFFQQLDPDYACRNNLFSFEDLVGSMGKGTYHKEIADQLKELGFRKIIITIRSQPRLIDSIYRQYVQEGGVARVRDYFKPEHLLFFWDYCDFYALISHYTELFGKDNLLVLPFEYLVKNKQEAVNRIAGFTGAQPGIFRDKNSNASLSNASLRLLRIANFFTFSPRKPASLVHRKVTSWKFRYALQEFIDPKIISRFSGKNLLLPKDILLEIRDRYAEGNSLLSEEFGLHLERYDYPMKGSAVR